MRWVALALSVACSEDAREQPVDALTDGSTTVPDVVVTIDGDAAVAEVSDRYLSFAIDTAQVVGGVFWNPDPTSDEEEVPVPPYDFDDPVLRELTALLAPAVLRIGGTAADLVVYDLDGSYGDLPDGATHRLTADQWSGVHRFATDLDLDLLFTLNAGPSARDADGLWDPANARTLVEHAAAMGSPVTVWELGNEVNAYLLMHGQAVAATDYGGDVATLRDLLDDVQPAGLTAGPSSAYWPVAGEFVPFAGAAIPAAGDALDVVTWHYYPQQSTRCPVATRPASAEGMLDPSWRAEVDTWAAETEAHRDAGNPNAQVWLGETGNAQCGGAPGVSDAFVGGFWWLDQLGRLALRGQQVVIRQTLSGSDYGLLSDDGRFAPRPDFWTSALHKQLVGTRVLAASTEEDDLVTYAHCGRDGGVVVMVLNPTDDDLDVGFEAEQAEAWVLTADDLSSQQMALNGAALPTTAVVPDLSGLESADGVVTFPARSYGFVRHSVGNEPAACR